MQCQQLADQDCHHHPRIVESKACVACAKARRRCGKERPRCLWCRTRSISCYYPPAKPSSFIALEDHSAIVVNTRPPTPELCYLSQLSFPLVNAQLESGWFASPETWTIDKPPTSLTSTPDRFSPVDLNRILRKVVRWLSQWVHHGSNPFIHRQLYQHRYPPCIQDAYMLLSSYVHKTASNEQMIFRIIEDRVTQLVAQGFPSPSAESGSVENSLAAFDALDALAHAQALLVYQCIGLINGSVRLRHLVEQHIPVLENWMAQLVAQNSQARYHGESLILSPSEETATRLSPVSPTQCEDLLWHSWILAESTRRTWLVTAGIQGIYKLIQKNTATCMGGTMFTSCRGFWEAPSALAWEKQCSEVYAGLVRLTEVDKLFAMVPRKEMNDFTKLVLECTFGVEQMERWGVWNVSSTL